ncbi:MAG: hypothetical protein BWY69_00581 [Planctomycetes bacterium ADurb.Bin401]|nr:MAG: hypothetical protein BWY69_00581 [Planctomycetes bacterium ADurb.Bin401]
MFKKLDDFSDFFFRFINTRYIIERNFYLFLAVHFVLASAEAHKHSARPAFDIADKHKIEKGDHYHKRNNPAKKRPNPLRFGKCPFHRRRRRFDFRNQIPENVRTINYGKSFGRLFGPGSYARFIELANDRGVPDLKAFDFAF